VEATANGSRPVEPPTFLSVGTGGLRDHARCEFYCCVGEGVGKPDCRRRCRENCREQMP
jgi:hypothetical protein